MMTFHSTTKRALHVPKAFTRNVKRVQIAKVDPKKAGKELKSGWIGPLQSISYRSYDVCVIPSFGVSYNASTLRLPLLKS